MSQWLVTLDQLTIRGDFSRVGALNPGADANVGQMCTVMHSSAS
jgi:hypothetical protein